MDNSVKKILVVIPAYNEGPRIGKVVRSVKSVLSKTTILVINDCSTDHTKQEAEKSGAIVLSHPINLGYASSLELGYLYALNEDFGIVVQLDGDGQHLAEEIPKILTPVLNQEADIVIGSRYLSVDSSYNTSFTRWLGKNFFSAIYYIVTRYNITDPTSGFQCLNRKAFQLFASGHFPDDFPDTDVLLIAHYAGLRIKEVPVVMLERSGGISMHFGLKPLYYIIKMILSMFMVILNYRRWRKYES
jgi:glycosyltransferase involved in cell wall biosynthesis